MVLEKQLIQVPSIEHTKTKIEDAIIQNKLELCKERSKHEMEWELHQKEVELPE